ncbi:MAG: alanine racemase [Synergistales bacterium]
MQFRPTRMEVRLDHLKSNFAAVKDWVGPRVQPIAVVKANGYGTGMLQAAAAFREAGAQRFAVAIPEEAVELRENGFSEPVLVLGASTPCSASEMVRLDISAACTDTGFARAMSEAAVRQGKPARIHLKIDTGMGRIGFLPEYLPEALNEILSLPGLEIEGVFTHFATADELNLDYTRWQFRRLGDVFELLRSRNLGVRLRHACNSAATLALPEMHLDAVRPGVILYGMWPSAVVRKSVDLKPVFEVKTAIACLRTLPAGSGVSYGLRYMTRGEERIAALPLGYNDGWTRLLNFKAEVLVRGRRAPVVGSICMDQCMINVNHIPEAQVGDEVVLIGSQGGETITVDEVAARLGTINYEIPGMFSRRVPRVYL